MRAENSQRPKKNCLTWGLERGLLREELEVEIFFGVFTIHGTRIVQEEYM